MQIDKRIYVVGSGRAGYNLTNPYDCDVYLIDCGDGSVMIDAGTGIEPEKIEEQIHFHGFSPQNIRYILLTHSHGDHVGGVAYFAEKYQIPVLAHPDSVHYLRNGDQKRMSVDIAEKMGLYPQGFQVQPWNAEPFKDGEEIILGDSVIEAIDAPGHCSGHNAYFLSTPEKRYLFSGDSIFLGGKISLQNIWDCRINEYAATAKRLDAIEFDALLPSHFGIDLLEGKKHVHKANKIFEGLGVPAQALLA